MDVLVATLPKVSSVIAGLITTLIVKLSGTPCAASDPPAFPKPTLGPDPLGARTRESEELYEIMKTVHELMTWTEQCLCEFNEDISWNDSVLDVMEVESLVPLLRQATILTPYAIHKPLHYRVQETSIYAMIFIVETRLHLFCYERQWMAMAAEDHVTLQDFPTISATVSSSLEDPFLYIPCSSLRATACHLSDSWFFLNTRDQTIDLDELTATIYWLYSRTALLVNTAYDDEILDEGGYAQQLDEDRNKWVANLDFVGAFAPFFAKVAQDLQLLGMLENRTKAPTQNMLSFVESHRTRFRKWIRSQLTKAVADDLVNKYARNYCLVEEIVDVGQTVRTERRERLEFGAFKVIDDVFEKFGGGCENKNKNKALILNTLWTFSISYLLEQKHGDTRFVQHIFQPRIDPRELLGSTPLQHPLLCRIPVRNVFVVLLDRQTCYGPFPDILDAFLVWLFVLERDWKTRLRHQTTGLWVSLAGLYRKTTELSIRERLGTS